MAGLKDTIPTLELQPYCDTIVSSSVNAIKENDDIDILSVSGLLEQSLPLTEDVIWEYALRALRSRPGYSIYRRPDKGLVKSMIIISNVLGERGLLLLLPSLSRVVADILWLITLMTQTAEIDIWKSEPFLSRFCAEVLDPAIARMEIRPALQSFVRDCNGCNSTIGKEELKLFIQRLKNLGLEKILDQLTSKMAQFDTSLEIDDFRDVLGDGQAEEYGKKRKAVEIKEEEEKKRPRLAMKDGKLIASYD
jgi:hypothetical protein